MNEPMFIGENRVNLTDFRTTLSHNEFVGKLIALHTSKVNCAVEVFQDERDVAVVNAG